MAVVVVVSKVEAGSVAGTLTISTAAGTATAHSRRSPGSSGSSPSSAAAARSSGFVIVLRSTSNACLAETTVALAGLYSGLWCRCGLVLRSLRLSFNNWLGGTIAAVASSIVASSLILRHRVSLWSVLVLASVLLLCTESSLEAIAKARETIATTIISKSCTGYRQ